MTVTDQPLAGDVLNTFNIADGSLSAPGCWTPFGDPYAELFCYFRDHRAQYFPAPPGDAVIPAAGFTVPDPVLFGFGGAADDDWQTGAPSFIYIFDSPGIRFLFNRAYTHATVHETGHYLGLSHPHDGYDSATGVDFIQSGAYNFAWIGDESSTVMSYTLGNEAYDQFDLDNEARWQVARLLDLADTDTAAILATPHSAQDNLQLVQADLQFTKAVVALHRSNWTTAATAAVAGYRDIQRIDAAVGVAPASAALAPMRAAAAQAQALDGDFPTRPRIDSHIAPKAQRDALNRSLPHPWRPHPRPDQGNDIEAGAGHETPVTTLPEGALTRTSSWSGWPDLNRRLIAPKPSHRPCGATEITWDRAVTDDLRVAAAPDGQLMDERVFGDLPRHQPTLEILQVHRT
jgi:hypothetical protein